MLYRGYPFVLVTARIYGRQVVPGMGHYTIKAVTFDFWSTLYRDLPDVAERRDALRYNLINEFLERFWKPVSEDEIKAAFAIASKENHRRWETEQKTFNPSESLRRILLGIGVEPDAMGNGDFVRLCHDFESVSLHEPPQIIPGAAETIAKLADRYRLGLICDTGLTPGRIIRQLMRRDGVLKHFTLLTFSDEFGHTKPHAANFLHTLSFLGVHPHEAVHIGDLIRTDIEGALSVGMHAVLTHAANRDELPEHHNGRVPVIKELRELPELIKGFEKN